MVTRRRFLVGAAASVAALPLVAVEARDAKAHHRAWHTRPKDEPSPSPSPSPTEEPSASESPTPESPTSGVFQADAFQEGAFQ